MTRSIMSCRWDDTLPSLIVSVAPTLMDVGRVIVPPLSLANALPVCLDDACHHSFYRLLNCATISNLLYHACFQENLLREFLLTVNIFRNSPKNTRLNVYTRIPIIKTTRTCMLYSYTVKVSLNVGSLYRFYCDKICSE